ncbi:MAG: class I SAM-dependent methyltransferase [Alphaproteobacteria bacterium]|nr:class I SAM-dependent methyltransferase [Alphaproteobacteria bacterium]
MPLDRRSLLSATAGTAVAAATQSAWAAKDSNFKLDADRGRDGIFRRIPSLDVGSNQDFLTEVRTMVQSGPGSLQEAAKARAKELLAKNGHAPDAELPMADVIKLMENDPTLMASARAWLSVQQLTWKGVKDLFDADKDRWLSELKSAEKAGPGSLELNPTMHIPDYARHEIHIQPGGYVGDPLAGYVYHYGTNNFFLGHNSQDQQQVGVASAAPVPADGKIRRILEIGCSCGQTSVALKRRFPEAEVWGVDVGGPMVHYAHMRAADLGVAVNFRQALAEQTGFPDGHFDMVVSFIILHEVPNSENAKIMKEVSRLLRPGGTYYPVDFYTAGAAPKDAYGKFRRWWDHRWNGEPWALQHMEYNLASDLTVAGMTVNKAGPGNQLGGPVSIRGGGRPNLMAIKA